MRVGMLVTTFLSSSLLFTLVILPAVGEAGGLVSLCERRVGGSNPGRLFVNNYWRTCDEIRDLDPKSVRDVELTFVPKDRLMCDEFSDLVNLNSMTLRGYSSELAKCMFRGLNRLTRLIVVGGNVGTLPDDVFSELPNLNLLWLYDIELRSLKRAHFRAQTELEFLSVAINRLDHFPEDLFADLVNLKQLYIQENPATSIPAKLFYPLPHLTVVSLGGEALQWIPDYAFMMQSKLERLNVRGSPLGSTGKAAFYGIGHRVIVEGLRSDFDTGSTNEEWRR